MLEVSRSFWEKGLQKLQEGSVLGRMCQSTSSALEVAAGYITQENRHGRKPCCCFLLQTTAPGMPEQPLLRDDSGDGCVLSCPVLLVLH